MTKVSPGLVVERGVPKESVLAQQAKFQRFSISYKQQGTVTTRSHNTGKGKGRKKHLLKNVIPTLMSSRLPFHYFAHRLRFAKI